MRRLQRLKEWKNSIADWQSVQILKSHFPRLYKWPPCAIIDITTLVAQLIVRKIEEKVVKKLKARAGLHGVSTEEEHRRILREALLGDTAKRLSFKEFLLKMPDAGPDSVFERKRDKGRDVEL